MSSLVPASQLGAAWATAVVSFLVAAVYLYFAYRLSQRDVAPGARLASNQFALWWGGIGVTAVVSGIEVALAAAGALALPGALTIYLVSILIDCAFLWGLVGFLVFVYTGRYHLLELTAFYAWFYITVLYFVFLRVPSGVLYSAGAVSLTYSAAAVPLLEVVIVLGLIVPEIVGAILYLSLAGRAPAGSAQRLRIWLVGGGILLWFAIDVFVPSSTAAWGLVRTVLELVPGAMSLIAFYPPSWGPARLRTGDRTPKGGSVPSDERSKGERPAAAGETEGVR